MPERLECEVLQNARYINALTFTFTFFTTVPRNQRNISFLRFVDNMIIILPRGAYDCCHKMSVCLSVCLTHAGILSKRLNISSNFSTFSHTILVFHTKRYGNIPTGIPYIALVLLTCLHPVSRTLLYVGMIVLEIFLDTNDMNL